MSVGEMATLLSAVALLVGAITTAIVQLIKLRRENTSQHAESRALVVDVRDRLLDIHKSVGHVDQKVDNLDARLDRHESIHHRGRRRW